MTKPSTASLTGLNVLVVEDEYLVADDLHRTLQAAGAQVLGPVPTVAEALSVVGAGNRIDGAVLDINLHGEMAYPVADALLARGVGFVFATGYDRQHVPARYGHVPCCEKPVQVWKLAEALFG